MPFAFDRIRTGVRAARCGVVRAARFDRPVRRVVEKAAE